jgi:hypothetical protein
VHKSFVVACIASADKQGVTTYQSHRFFTFSNGLRMPAQWLLKNDCRDVCSGEHRKVLDSGFQRSRNDLFGRSRPSKARQGE